MHLQIPRQKTAPLRTIRFSKKFLEAALRVQPPATSAKEALTQHPSLVAYFLVGHSIELSLKAFLLGRGIPIEHLRSVKKHNFGHNLSRLLVESRRRKLGKCVKLNTREIKLVHLLNECYETKELEYIFTGSRQLPPYPELLTLASKLRNGIAPYCETLAVNHLRKTT